MSWHGWLVVDKPAGMSSAQVVGKVKRLLKNLPLPLREGLGEGAFLREGTPHPGPLPQGERGLKIGHAGTLDPFATGVLPLALGEATKTAGYGLDKDKCYDFTLSFGEARDTEDCTGNIIETSDKRPSLAEIEAILPLFRGTLTQIPPIYSAIHVNGQRAYALARAGEVVEMEPRQITIHSLICHPGEGRDPRQATERKNVDPVLQRDDGVEQATFSVTCSKGTYIRSLARDIALKLGTVGHVSALRRVKSGVFTLAEAISLENLGESANEGALLGLLKPAHAVLDDIPVLHVNGEEAANLRNGKALIFSDPIPDSLMQARLGDELIALGQATGRIFKPQRVFNY